MLLVRNSRKGLTISCQLLASCYISEKSDNQIIASCWSVVTSQRNLKIRLLRILTDAGPWLHLTKI